MSGAQELADQDVRAFNEQNLEGKLRIASPELEFVVPGATLHGPDETAAFARALWEAFPDARITPGARVATGSRAAIEGSFTGTHLGTLHTPGGDIPATGRSVDFRCVVLYEVAAARIGSKHFYFDRMELMTQIGAMPAPAEG